MKKRVIIVHGWGGDPDKDWIPWLKKNLELRDFQVLAPKLPQADKPRIHNWIPALTQSVGEVDTKTYFVGHSIGCQTIARYLETLPPESKIGGAVFVAGFFKKLTGQNSKDEKETTNHWIGAKIDLTKIKRHLPRSIAIFSKDDPWVPLENQDEFKNKLGSKIVIVDGRKHFSGDEGVVELPEALNSLLELANEN